MGQRYIAQSCPAIIVYVNVLRPDRTVDETTTVNVLQSARDLFHEHEKGVDLPRPGVM